MERLTVLPYSADCTYFQAFTFMYIYYVNHISIIFLAPRSFRDTNDYTCILYMQEESCLLYVYAAS